MFKSIASDALRRAQTDETLQHSLEIFNLVNQLSYDLPYDYYFHKLLCIDFESGSIPDTATFIKETYENYNRFYGSHHPERLEQVSEILEKIGEISFTELNQIILRSISSKYLIEVCLQERQIRNLFESGHKFNLFFYEEDFRNYKSAYELVNATLLANPTLTQIVNFIRARVPFAECFPLEPLDIPNGPEYIPPVIEDLPKEIESLNYLELIKLIPESLDDLRLDYLRLDLSGIVYQKLIRGYNIGDVGRLKNLGVMRHQKRGAKEFGSTEEDSLRESLIEFLKHLYETRKTAIDVFEEYKGQPPRDIFNWNATRLDI